LLPGRTNTLKSEPEKKGYDLAIFPSGGMIPNHFLFRNFLQRAIALRMGLGTNRFNSLNPD
jgi:hypothetical protein